MPTLNRRTFLKASGLTTIPALLPASAILATPVPDNDTPPEEIIVKFYGDGESYSPTDYLRILGQTGKPVERDVYGKGGVVEALENKFREITGKENAIYMPSGTMANQLAISVLSGENAKVFVQETSHVFRDEADAAQTVFSKRLIPLAKGETYFTADQLAKEVEYINNEEVFRSGMGCVSIENPVRRTDGRMIPIEEIRKISAFCRSNNLKLHLDGARIYMASAWSGVSIREYASYFDTIYISLYKYLGATGGAILCGDKSVISKMPHLVKVHGGTMYANWPSAAMALHRLEGFETRMKETVKKSAELFAALNKVPGIRIAALPGGTNIFKLQFGKDIDGVKAGASLANDYSIRIPKPNANNESWITVNETILYRENGWLVSAFGKAIKK